MYYLDRFDVGDVSISRYFAAGSGFRICMENILNWVNLTSAIKPIGRMFSCKSQGDTKTVSRSHVTSRKRVHVGWAAFHTFASETSTGQ